MSTAAAHPPSSSGAVRRDALLLIVDDREDNRVTIAEAFERQGYAVLTAAGGQEALRQIAEHAPDLVICDLKMPDMDGLEVLRTARAAQNPPEIILLTAYGTVETAVDALKLGAFNYLTKPVNLKDLRAQAEKALEHRQLRRDVGRYRRQAEVAAHNGWPEQFVFESPAMRRLMEMVRRLAPTQSNVLIDGESGVGKEVVAQALHNLGPDPAARPFIVVHCAALPESLLEAELFGHEKGAFTGAEKQTLGRLELADGGTLFLDEIGEVPLAMQVKLLRVLEQRELMRVGGRRVIRVNFRLLAATNRNLEEEVAAGRFREDLFYRLNVVRLRVPPLRERRDDILPLLRHFLTRFAAEGGQPQPRLTPEVERRLVAYPWPGNVRELRNLAERLSIFAAGRELRADDLPFEIANPFAAGRIVAGRGLGPGSAVATDMLDLQQIERITIERALARFGGNRSAAAEALGISRRTLQRKLKEYQMAAQEDEDDSADENGD
ncbi:MAG TPA: sigma-54 dependent transcriptional regulator [Candidatus Sumerlaeota bacterium]|nr:sigma-54 dependent transcriptional regulator [Candidatus Sumerlaeota bacterium]